jgi:hypothetical protein
MGTCLHDAPDRVLGGFPLAVYLGKTDEHHLAPFPELNGRIQILMILNFLPCFHQADEDGALGRIWHLANLRGELKMVDIFQVKKFA